MKKTKNWIFLTIAGTLAVLLSGRVREAVALDPDTLLGAR